MEKEPDIIQSFIKLGCRCSNNGYHLYDIQKWLREVKELHITIFSQSQESWMFRITKPGQTLSQGIYGEDYENFEEALEAGIWEAYFILNN